MSVREVLEHLHSITATIVGADIVEYNPSRDVSELTATSCRQSAEGDFGKDDDVVHVSVEAVTQILFIVKNTIGRSR